MYFTSGSDRAFEQLMQTRPGADHFDNRLGKNACTSHKIEARDLYNLVLKDIQELAKTALKDADAFYQRLSSRMERRYLLDA